jgi:NAD(P)-dependent dehydrogenase (short-subunit alcohol dehydrogenase family)
MVATTKRRFGAIDIVVNNAVTQVGGRSHQRIYCRASTIAPFYRAGKSVGAGGISLR